MVTEKAIREAMNEWLYIFAGPSCCVIASLCIFTKDKTVMRPPDNAYIGLFRDFPILRPDVWTDFGPIWASMSGPEQTFAKRGQDRPDPGTRLLKKQSSKTVE